MLHPPTIILWEEGIEGEDYYALDNLCCSACFVVIGTGHFLHFGWFHTPPAGGGYRRDLVSVHSRPKKNRIIAER
jgi:hypothetical protein